VTGGTAAAGMDDELRRYFARERAGSLAILLIAAAGGALAAWLVAVGSPYRAMAWPLALIGIVQLAVGATIFLRTPRQAARLAECLRSSPAAYRAEESARMRRVQRSFVFYKRVEIGLLALGLALASVEGYGRTLYAVGMGLMLEAGVMLAFDLVAERRGARYLEWVESLRP
jgi:MFS family permease